MKSRRLGQRGILIIIVASQFMSTSLWFAGNAVIDGLVADLGIPVSALGPITSAVQFGFIGGTLLFAVLTLADRLSPSKVFFVSAMCGAIANAALLLRPESFALVLAARMATGFFLAGSYPVGMKIAADHFPEGLGKALGFLLAALVLGTASPHLIRTLVPSGSWEVVIVATSLAAMLGGVLVLILIPDGAVRHAATKFDFGAFFNVFKNRSFRSAAFGYFGHMWELYAFWAFIPLMLYSIDNNMEQNANSALSFSIIGAGALGCIAGGYLSARSGSARVAFMALAISGLCCLLSPVVPQLGLVGGVLLMLIWGMAVIADSPQFSTLVAVHAPPKARGTALTIVNCIGFSITIVSIQLINTLSQYMQMEYAMLLLVPGPVFGLVRLYPLLSESRVS